MTDLWPAVNASLNGLAALCLLAGLVMVRTGRISAHRACMLAAVCLSALFLISYLVYHARVGSTRFLADGGVRQLYFIILISHTILAAIAAPLVVLTLRAGLRDRVARHRRLARWTFPIWLYVSVTGVVIYFMLYRMGYPTA